MIDQDEMRRRRVERLATLERAEAEKAKSQKPQKPENTTAATVETKRNSIQNSTRKISESGKTVSKPPPGDGSLRKQPKISGQHASMASQQPSATYIFQSPQPIETNDWEQMVAQSSFDGILWERITSGSVQPLLYLNECYQRSEKLTSSLQHIRAAVQQSILTMAFICATSSADDEVHDDLSKALLDSAFLGALSKSFVSSLFTQILGDDEEAFEQLTSSTLGLILNSLEFGSPSTSAAYTLLGYLVEVPAIAEVMLRHPAGPIAPSKISQMTYLGKLLGIGAGADGLSQLVSLDTITGSTLGEFNEIAKMTEPMTQLLDHCQFHFVEKLIRLNKSSRRRVLDWFGMVLNANHGQMAMNRVLGKTNSLQLMINALKILLRLAEPFTTLDSATLMQQLSKINSSYFADRNSYDIADQTKTLASENAPFNSHDQDLDLNFVTECFYLCAGFLHFGFHATIQSLDVYYKQQIAHIERELNNLNQSHNGNPMVQNLHRITCTRFNVFLKKLKCEYSGLYTVLHNTEFIAQVLRFSEFNLMFDIYAAEGRPSLNLEIRIPWDNEIPVDYASMPEFLVEAPLASASWILRSLEFMRTPTMSMSNQLLIDAAIFFMSSPKVLRNPYLRSRFVEIFFYGGSDIPLTSGSTMPGALSTLFTTSDICRKFLLPALMSVFIDIEHTGRASQFYEKFNTRELVANVLKVLWRDPHYRSQLVTESQSQPDFFVKFVALLLNDATFLLDEALSKLLEVHKLQNSQESQDSMFVEPEARLGTNNEQASNSEQPSNEDTMSENGENTAEEGEEQSQDPSSLIESAERQVRNFLHLSNSTMTLLYTFTSTVPHIFAIPEIIDRFAVMLNYNLAALVGPRCNELKVRNRAELGFNPRQLLTDLVRVYLNLRNEQPFPKSLSKDERSYKDENFTKAQNILSKFSLISPIELDQFADLAKRTREAWKETQEEEQDYGDDIPDEFLDPLMFDIMQNPVTLPTSKVNIDLSTIKTHLLSDPTDPFNRVPLKIEDVIPNTKLKKEIDTFRQMKKKQRNKT